MKTKRCRSTVWTLCLLAFIIISGAALRGAALDTQSYWHDEIYSVAHLYGFDAYLFPGSDLSATEIVKPVEEWLEPLGEERYLETLPRNILLGS